MSHPVNDIIYDKILEDEAFINDLWNTLGQTDKISVLQKAGFDMLEEYSKVYGSAEDNQTLEI